MNEIFYVKNNIDNAKALLKYFIKNKRKYGKCTFYNDTLINLKIHPKSIYYIRVSDFFDTKGRFYHAQNSLLHKELGHKTINYKRSPNEFTLIEKKRLI